MSQRSGIGYDSHPFADGRRLVLGGVEIEEAERGLGGHSDADALTHSIIDALLGAAGLGDIGEQDALRQSPFTRGPTRVALERVRAELA